MNKEILERKNRLFVAATVGMILTLFFIGHIGLVTVYRSGTAATLTCAALMGAAAIALFTGKPRHRFFALLAGTMLWALVGEIAERLGYFTIVNPWFIFALLAGGGAFFRFAAKGKLSQFPLLSLTLFFGVWTSHFIMVNFFEILGKRHWGTIVSSLLFAVALAYALRRISRSTAATTLAAHSIILTCAVWSLLEYFWAWKLIPKLW